MIYKAISIQQPWAWAILHAGKDVENRTWPVPASLQLPCRLVIHAGKKVDDDGKYCLYHWGIRPPANLPTGCLLGEVTVMGYHEIGDPGFSGSKWAFGPYCWCLKDPAAYVEPIPYRGQLGIFEVEI